MIGRLKHLARDKSGAAVVELALAAPILAMMVIGVTDISMAYGKKLELEQAAQRAIEKVMQTTGVKSVDETIIDEVADQANIPDAEKATKITVTYSLECDDAAPQTSSDAVTFDAFTCAAGTESEVRYIEVQVRDVYDPMFPVHFSGYSSSEEGYPIVATAGMRTQ